MPEQSIAVDGRRLEVFVATLLRAAGLPVSNARISARVIVQADRWGLSSHGVFRISSYMRRLEAGGIVADAAMRLRGGMPSTALYDGGGGLGHWQVWRATKRAASIAGTTGVALVAVGDSNHCGSLGVYAALLRQAGYAGLIFTNGPAAMPPWGGRDPILGTNPIAGTFPSSSGGPIVDLATTAVARGRIAEAARRGQRLEPGWALDAAGQPTVDPVKGLQGMLAPLGGVKGYALAALVESLTSVMVGPALSADVVDPFDVARAGDRQKLSHVVIAIQPDAMDLNGGRESRYAELSRRIHLSGGRIPGERRHLGKPTVVTIEAATISELRRWAGKLGVVATV